ncbi:MAG: ABC transporter permease [Actinomycetes bacterium]
MSARATLATTRRVLGQLRHDHRTLVLLLVVPCVLITLLAWIYEGSGTFDRIGAPLLGLFPFVVMFLVTSVATLRERTSGTLERLLTMPIGKLDLLVGYALAFGALAAIQAGLAGALAIYVLGLDVAGPVGMVFLVAVLDALLGMALGLFVSAFAATEFQAVQFMPAVVLPQFLLCGLLIQRDQMNDVLYAVSSALPLSYAVDAMSSLVSSTAVDPEVWADLGVIVGCIVLALGVGAATLRRRTA